MTRPDHLAERVVTPMPEQRRLLQRVDAVGQRVREPSLPCLLLLSAFGLTGCTTDASAREPPELNPETYAPSARAQNERIWRDMGSDESEGHAGRQACMIMRRVDASQRAVTDQQIAH